LFQQLFHFFKSWLFHFPGGEFLMKHFKDPATGKVFFSTTRDGKPTKMQRTIFSEVFYSMAMAGLAKATQQTKYKVMALRHLAYRHLAYRHSA
jgi:hypothetical protein